MAGLDNDTLDAALAALGEFVSRHLGDEKLLALDARDECPEETVRAMCGAELGIHLFFVAAEWGGMGGGAFDLYRICEHMARTDLGVATSVLATFLGSEPVAVGGTPEQRKLWLSRIADEGLLMAYAATEPAAGSDLAALRSVATPVEEDGRVVGYKISGSKQWISNGGIADLYCVLASAPGGPSWFVVEKGATGLTHGKPEDKHGIRLSNTAALSFEEVTVDADRLVGGVEGQGLVQALSVFGYTRLMVAAFGLGAGWAALDRAIAYSTTRLQAGGPLSEKQGYTHKLIVPHAVRLEAARAYIEGVATRIDAGEGSLNTEGAVAKYLATEAGNAAAEASIQALGGYGYTRDYMVEKIKRDVRITTIYEGTSEIMEMTISRDRWQQHLKTRGEHYHERARALEALDARDASVGAGTAALAVHALAALMERARKTRLTRHQHVLFRIGELIAQAEGAASFAERAAAAGAGSLNEKADVRFGPAALATLSRIFAREAARRVANDGLALLRGAGGVADEELAAAEGELQLQAVYRAQAGLLADMDAASDAIYRRGGARGQQAA